MQKLVTMVGATNYDPSDPGSYLAVDAGRFTRLSQGWVSMLSPIV